MHTSPRLMRARYPIALLVVLAATLSTANSAAALGDRRIPLMIQTVPEMPGARFTLDGRKFTADKNGLAVIGVLKPDVYRLSLLSDSSNDGRRGPRFIMWSDGQRSPARSVGLNTFTFLEAGFETSSRVSFQFLDRNGAELDPERIESIILFDSAHNRVRLMGAGPHRLVSGAPTLDGSSMGLVERDYRVQYVFVGGKDVLPQSITLRPSVDSEPSIQLAISNTAASQPSPQKWDALVWGIVGLIVAALAVLIVTTKAY